MVPGLAHEGDVRSPGARGSNPGPLIFLADCSQGYYLGRMTAKKKRTVTFRVESRTDPKSPWQWFYGACAIETLARAKKHMMSLDMYKGIYPLIEGRIVRTEMVWTEEVVS